MESNAGATLFVYIVDNCVSPTYLDAFKCIIEYILISAPNQRRMLFHTSGEVAQECLLSTVLESTVEFERRLKNIEPNLDPIHRNTTIGNCIHYCLRIFNAYRIKEGTDTIGQGRCPWLLAAVTFMVFTADDTRCASHGRGATPPTLAGDGTSSLDNMFFTTPFRWDHRVFCAFLKDFHRPRIGDGSEVTDNTTRTSDATLTVDHQNEMSVLCKSTVGDLLVFKPGLPCGNSNNKSSSNTPDVIQSSDRTLRPSPTELRSFAHRLLIESVAGSKGVGVLLKPAGICNGANAANVLARLILPSVAPVSGPASGPKGGSEPWWPLPESFWIDQSVEALPRRFTFPVLKLCSNVAAINNNEIFDSGTSMGATSGGSHMEHAGVYLAMAKELGIPVDTYELAPVVGAPQSLKKSLGLHRNECCHMSVEGSGSGRRANTVRTLVNGAAGDVTAVIGGSGTGSGGHGGSSGSFTSGSSGGSAHGDDNSSDKPCAILTARSQTPGCAELVVLPYNYPVLLPLIKTAAERLKGASVVQDQPWFKQLRVELSNYILNVPANYYPKVLQLLKHVRMQLLLHTNQKLDNKIHNTPFRHIQRVIGFAIIEIAEWEAVAKARELRSRREGILRTLQSSSSIPELALNSCDPSKRLIDLQQNVFDIPPTELLRSWERLHLMLFGGSDTSLTGAVRSADDGIVSCPWNNGVERDEQSWFESAVGGQAMCSVTCADMGSYYALLAQRETLRDPEATRPDEDTIEGLIQRKLSVNFGNRFKGDQGAAGVLEIETNRGVKMLAQAQRGITDIMQDAISSSLSTTIDIAADGADGTVSVGIGGTGNERLSRSGSGLLQQQHQLIVHSLLRQADEAFMDTPLPPRISGDDVDGDGACGGHNLDPSLSLLGRSTESVPNYDKKRALSGGIAADAGIHKVRDRHLEGMDFSAGGVMELPPLGVPFQGPTTKRRKLTARDNAPERNPEHVKAILPATESSIVSMSMTVCANIAGAESTSIRSDNSTSTVEFSLHNSPGPSSPTSVAPGPLGDASTMNQEDLAVRKELPVDIPIQKTPSLPQSQQHSSHQPQSHQHGFSEHPELPPGWQECFSKTHQRQYWFNPKTGERSWQRPS